MSFCFFLGVQLRVSIVNHLSVWSLWVYVRLFFFNKPENYWIISVKIIWNAAKFLLRFFYSFSYTLVVICNYLNGFDLNNGKRLLSASCELVFRVKFMDRLVLKVYWLQYKKLRIIWKCPRKISQPSKICKLQFTITAVEPETFSELFLVPPHSSIHKTLFWVSWSDGFGTQKYILRIESRTSRLSNLN